MEGHNLGILADENTQALYGWKNICFKLVMQKDILPVIPKAKANGQKLLYDIDDHFDGLQPDNLAYQNTDPKTNPENNRDIYKEIIALTDTVVTSTPFLRDYYSERHPDVRMIRNGVDIQRYTMRKQAKRPIIGWVGATPWRTKDLEILDPWLNKYLLRKNLRFWHSGETDKAATFAERAGVTKTLVDSWPMMPITRYPAMF